MYEARLSRAQFTFRPFLPKSRGIYYSKCPGKTYLQRILRCSSSRSSSYSSEWATNFTTQMTNTLHSFKWYTKVVNSFSNFANTTRWIAYTSAQRTKIQARTGSYSMSYGPTASLTDFYVTDSSKKRTALSAPRSSLAHVLWRFNGFQIFDYRRNKYFP